MYALVNNAVSSDHCLVINAFVVAGPTVWNQLSTDITSPLRHSFLNSSGNSKHTSCVSLILTMFNLYFHFFIVVLEAFVISHWEN